MGENDNRPIVAAYVDGEWRSFGYLDELRDISNGPDGPWLDDPGPPGEPAILTDPVIITGRFIPEPRMSRKRFIKLLMSKGCPRNFSVALAPYWLKQGVPYADAWLYMTIFCF